MIIKYNRKNKIIQALAVFILAVALNACSSDDDAKSSEVRLDSFGPSGIHFGETISFIGNRLDKVTAIELPGATIESSQFTTQTSERIEFVVPPETGEGKVILKTDQGDIESKTVLSFEVPVEIESFSAEVKPGGTLTITGDHVNWIKEVWLADDVLATDVVSRSLNEIVFTVPLEAQTGKIVIITGGTKPLTIKPEDVLTVTLPAISILSPNPVAREENLTITGTNLDLVMQINFKGSDPITEFVSQSETEIVVIVPASTNKGNVTIVAFSGVEVVSTEALNIVGDLPALAPLDYAFYIDAIENGWGNWGWGGAVDFANTENVRDGAATIKKTYDGSWDALRFGGGNVQLASYTEITFSIFGTPGTNGLKLNVIPNEQWGSPYVITIVEGEWTEYKLTKADFGNPTQFTDFLFQAQGWAGVLYVDHVGLRQ
jgi:hypothetical protein